MDTLKFGAEDVVPLAEAGATIVLQIARFVREVEEPTREMLLNFLAGLVMLPEYQQAREIVQRLLDSRREH